jgi:hypothetical protein
MNKYRDAADIFDHLKTLFEDVDRVVNVKAKYRRLFMNASLRLYSTNAEVDLFGHNRLRAQG